MSTTITQRTDQQIVEDAAGRIVRFFQYDEKVSHDWLYEAFGLQRPRANWSFEEGSRTQLRYMSLVSRLRDLLLTEHDRDLVAVTGHGHRILKPSDQVVYSGRDSDTEILKSLRKRKRRQDNVNTERLDDAERARLADETARTDTLRQMILHSRSPRGRRRTGGNG